MSETGLEEKVENMNVEEKEPKAQKKAKGGDKSKGEKKKKEDPSEFPLEVSSFMRVSVCVSLPYKPCWLKNSYRISFL